jgi:hypothetical protein
MAWAARPGLKPGGQLTLTGGEGGGYEILMSTNLVDRVTLDTNGPRTSTLTLSDTNAANFSRRCYRARIAECAFELGWRFALRRRVHYEIVCDYQFAGKRSVCAARSPDFISSIYLRKPAADSPSPRLASWQQRLSALEFSLANIPHP